MNEPNDIAQKKTKRWPIPSWVPHKPKTDCDGAGVRLAKSALDAEGLCQYCGLDLAKSTELLVSSELDHLVPKEVFRNAAETGYVKDGDYRTNLVFCCGPCNDAKANWPLCLPEAEARRVLSSLERKDYFSEARKFTRKRRASVGDEFADLMARLWAQRSSHRRKTKN